jgi:hypothetical protein
MQDSSPCLTDWQLALAALGAVVVNEICMWAEYGYLNSDIVTSMQMTGIMSRL